MTDDRLIIKVVHKQFCMPLLLFTLSHKVLLKNTGVSICHIQGGLRMLVPCAKYCMLLNAHGVHRGSSCPQCSRRPKHILRAVSLCGNAQISVSKIDQ